MAQLAGRCADEDLLPLLGNEIALSIPVKTLELGFPNPSPSPGPDQPTEGSGQKAPPPSGPSPIMAILVKDKDAVRTLIPRLIDSLGFKGANLLAQTEKRGDTELVSYANAISYAFIGNFLVAGTDTKAIRHVVDAYRNHQTLASDSQFRNYTRWQPRQVGKMSFFVDESAVVRGGDRGGAPATIMDKPLQ